MQVRSGSVQVKLGSVQKVRESQGAHVTDFAPLRLVGSTPHEIQKARAVLSLPANMPAARRYQDLIIWQLADQIRVLVFELTERQCFRRDLKLHSQTEDAVNSVCRNIAEGFGCKHKEFARFLEISRRSLNELGDSFRSAQLKRYVTAHEYEQIWRLTHRLYPAYAKLIRYLQTTPDPDYPDTARRRTMPKSRHTDRKPAPTGLKSACTDSKPRRTE